MRYPYRVPWGKQIDLTGWKTDCERGISAKKLILVAQKITNQNKVTDVWPSRFIKPVHNSSKTAGS